MSIGIYKYENKINGHIYIGQSLNIEVRYQQHLYDAEHRAEDCSGVDIAIKKYGIENFTFEIIELCDAKELDEKERYWISHYNSFNNGYNRTPGGSVLRGEEHPRAILSEQQVWTIRELYGKRVKRDDVFKMFKDTGITERGFLKIWNCETWPDVHNDVYNEENKQWHKKQVGHSEDQIGLSSLDRAINQDEINLWVEDYKNGMTINAIAKKYNRDNGTVEKYIANPVAVTKVKYKGRQIQNVNTGQIFKSISAAAKWAGCGATTLTRHLVSDGIAGKVPETGEPANWIEIS